MTIKELKEHLNKLPDYWERYEVKMCHGYTITSIDYVDWGVDMDTNEPSLWLVYEVYEEE